MSLRSRLSNVFRRERLTREIDEEFNSHIEHAVASGRDPGEARKAFGPGLRAREESGDALAIAWLDSVRADTIFGWRQLRRHNVASAAAILSLALGIGACVSAFRLIDALLLRPLPVSDPERLYTVAFSNKGMDGYPAEYDSSSYPMFERMRDAVSGQADLVAVSYADRPDITFGTDQETERVYLQFVSGRMFSLFDLRPALGRLLTGGDDPKPGANPYAVLSYDYWSRRFGRDPGVIGRTFRRGDTLFEVVGVTEASFTGTETGTVTDVFVPMAMKSPATLASSDNFWLRTFVKLKPGVAAEPVYDRLRVAFQDFQANRAKGFTNFSRQQLEKFFAERLLMEPAAAGRSNLQRDYGRSLMALAILVALVLLIACANVANLMTAWAAARGHEIALRVSIGAGRARLLQMLIIESAWIALLSTAAGAVFAWWAAPFVVGLINPPGDPARLALSADWRVVAFGLALALAVALLFGLVPALRASSVKPAVALKGGEDPHARRRLMHGLIAAQVAFCFLVLFVAGLFIDTFHRLSNRPTGFSSERILNLQTVARQPQPAAFWEEVAERLRAVPGVERVTMTAWPMMIGESAVDAIALPGERPSESLADFLDVSPGWLEEMKIALLDGRDLRAGDVNPSVALVSKAFAKQYFGGANPVGLWFERGEAKRVRVRIVGLVADARSRDNMRIAIRPTAYIPLDTADARGVVQPRGRGTFVVRTAGADSLAMAPALRAAVARARPEFHVDSIRTQAEIVRAPMLRERLLAMLSAFFTMIALILAGVGLYGVLDYSVLQRRREIGIRMAIGARRGDIARSVTVPVFAVVAGGAMAGVLLGLAAARYVESLLFGAKISDPRMMVMPSICIAAVALLGALRPVIRAVRVDPASILRME